LSKPLGKRLFDVVFSLLVIILVLSWLIPIVGVLIKLSSSGPMLFLQKRTGFKGVAFDCFKFRTMTYKPNADFKQATRYDSRVTSVGRFLRKTNLDEMPQFINVLLGDMSIVGPRPHAVQHSAQFWNGMPEYRKRYRIKPGITGLAQVRGCRGETDQLMKMQHRIKYDIFYIKNKSLVFDIYICWLTIQSMIKGDKHAW
jgi:putative colanic acid biosynthesis UDP-glucose lipid carrier transferase